jgi:mannosyl-oligosaccharide alpha-1,2-mannosidase
MLSGLRVTTTAIFKEYLGSGYRYSRLQLNNRDTFYNKQRAALYIALAVVILLLLSLLRPKSYDDAFPESTCPSRPPKTAFIPANHSRFNWRTIPTRHPVDRLTRLPDSDPLVLPKIQFDFGPPSALALTVRNSRQTQVRNVFKRCWDAYRAKAWLKDELAPLTGAWKNTFGGWGATLVDSLDTLLIMGFRDEFEEAVSSAVDIDFSPEASSFEIINMFETTIRYLGGFLAAYDATDCQDKRLLAKAVEVGDMIYASFDTPTRMPITRWNPRKAARGEEQGAAENAIIAEFASCSMEFTRLSQVTGDMRWFDASQRLTNVMKEQQQRTRLPGLWPIGINATAPDLTVGNIFSLGSMADSAYEYMPKMFALLNGAEPASQYAELTANFMDAAMKHMFFRPVVPDNANIRVPGIVTVSQFDGSLSLDPQGQHLSCYVGGMLLLSGKLFNQSDQVELGRLVTEGCVWAYKHGTIGIMPEKFHMQPCADVNDCTWHEGDPQDGFTKIDEYEYKLRPEAIESVFYLYRLTGDERLQDVAWEMFEAITAHTTTPLANAAISDVTNPDAPQRDNMESFWLGETLKYFYLIFSDPNLISLDDYVFNTEAHPFRKPRR